MSYKCSNCGSVEAGRPSGIMRVGKRTIRLCYGCANPGKPAAVEEEVAS